MAKKNKKIGSDVVSPYLNYSSIPEDSRCELIDALLTEKPIMEMMAKFDIDFDTLMLVGLVLEDVKTQTLEIIGGLNA